MRTSFAGSASVALEGRERSDGPNSTFIALRLQCSVRTIAKEEKWVAHNPKRAKILHRIGPIFESSLQCVVGCADNITVCENALEGREWQSAIPTQRAF